MKFEANISFTHRGVKHKKGEIYTFNERDAIALKSLGMIKPAKECPVIENLQEIEKEVKKTIQNNKNNKK